jgi:rod shape-determining protein MreC
VNLAPDSFASRRDTLAFVVCLILSFAARLAPPVVQETAAAAIGRTILAPFLFLQEQSQVIKASRGRYAQVIGLRDSVLVRALATTGLEEENDRLRGLLGLSSRLRVRHVSAEVLHQSSPASGLVALLSAGADAGVTPKSPVVAEQGLVGVVQTAGADRSVALLWTHPDFRVSAMTRDGSVFGIVAPRGSEGPNTMLLELRGVPYQQDVAPGTVVYTSGLGGRSGVYPRGIPIGTVLAVGDEQEGWARTYVVRPAVHPAAVGHVIVLTGTTVDVGDLFAGDMR